MLNKYVDISVLKAILKKNKHKKVSLCHGVFDLLHIGHIRHLKRAKSISDILIVSVTEDKQIKKGLNSPHFNETLRVEALASLEFVDYVVLSKSSSAEKNILDIKPTYYVKGNDYKNLKLDRSKKILKEIKAIKKVKGEIYFTNEITSSSSTLLNKYFSKFNQNQNLFLEKFKSKYELKTVLNLIDRFKNLKTLIIGETIIDQYFFLETIGKSSKDPYIVSKLLNKNQFIGGAASVAKAFSDLGCETSFISMLGEDGSYKNLLLKSFKNKINCSFLYKKNSPTILKSRYLETISKNKLFGVYDINDSKLTTQEEKKVLGFLKNISLFDLVIVLDYGHGFLTDKLLNYIYSNKKNFFICSNAQINAFNIGYHTLKKYLNSDLLIVNENELRHELRDKSSLAADIIVNFFSKNKLKNLVLTRGKNGSLSIDKKNINPVECPSFTNNIVDKVGAGDTFLSAYAPSYSLTQDIMISSFLGNIAGSYSTNNLANSANLDISTLLNLVENSYK